MLWHERDAWDSWGIRVAKVSAYDIPNYKTCPPEYVNKLEERRYCPNTIKTYCSLFEEFINHYPDKKLDDFGEAEVMEFSRFLVVDRKVSSSSKIKLSTQLNFILKK